MKNLGTALIAALALGACAARVPEKVGALSPARAEARTSHPARAAKHPAMVEARRLAAEPAIPVRRIEGRIDRSGRKEKGLASFYGRKFDGRRMANGERFDPNSNAAASKTLPIGTVAKVKNLANGRVALVEIKDHGPHVRGRVVDVTPKVARKLAMVKRGVVPVVVAPVTVPLPDGGVKLGAGAAMGKPLSEAAK